MLRAALLAVVLTAAIAVPAATAAPDPLAGAWVAGAGTFAPGCTTGGNGTFCDDRSFSFRLAAISGSSGTRAFGYFDRTNLANGSTFRGLVTCLSVASNKMAIGGLAAPPSGTPVAPFLVYVSDNDVPAADGISPFLVYGPGEALPTTGFPFACPSPQSELGYFDLTSGHITVR